MKRGNQPRPWALSRRRFLQASAALPAATLLGGCFGEGEDIDEGVESESSALANFGMNLIPNSLPAPKVFVCRAFAVLNQFDRAIECQPGHHF